MSDYIDRKRRLEEALAVANRVGNTFMANNIRTALQELTAAYREHPPYQDREL